ncbi:hypothetical protein Q9233_010530 [Columba guinea]|nr:hypothetical protein Q9233_010530 [Columba guinea]
MLGHIFPYSLGIYFFVLSPMQPDAHQCFCLQKDYGFLVIKIYIEKQWAEKNKNTLINDRFYMLQFSCRINRILESPRGNALLAGVGGSGKQSLTRLAAFISSLKLFQITLRKGYGIPDLRVDLGIMSSLTGLQADLANLYLKAGVKNIGTVFLMTDAQVADEQFLVLVNDFLASGTSLVDFSSPPSQRGCAHGSICSSRIYRRAIYEVVLCFSPVGSKLRVRSRRFPAIVSCTAVDWFQEWPQEALESVSLRFLQEIETVEDSVKDSISKFMAYVHTSVNEISRLYLSNERRYNYTTPKSFLEQIKLYQNLLLKKGKDLKARMERLENGLEKLKSTSAQVDELKARLAAQELELKQKNEDADKLIWVVGAETEKVSREKAIADEEEQKVALITQEVEQKQKDCEEDLAKAEPALEAAQAALNTLNKNNLTELRSFGSPPSAVSNVTAAVMVLMAPGGKIPKDRSWKAAKAAMARVDGFLDSLIKFDKENIHENCLKALQPYLQDPKFKPEFVTTKSSAAAGLCSWVVNMVQFHAVFCERLNENLRKLTAKFEKATSNKLKCQQEAEATVCTIALANRLVGGLASENVRWAEAVKNFKQQQSTLCGDILLITAFISYLGYFTEKYRQDLLDEIWKQTYLHQLKVPIPVTPSLDPLTMLTDDADVAAWQNEGLPADRMSTENATILTNCERWPLMVDPQLQGIKWMKTKYGEDLQVIRIGQKGYLDTMERALAAGELVLIENLEESMDPVLGPLLGRETIKKGRYIKIGDKECDFNPAFRLILHTKLANPHFQPELQAQCTLINFTVTRDGLEDQLLAAVVNMERPDLEELKSNLTKQQNGFKITLKTLEDNLLSRLSSASGNFLGDTALVENLEITKQTAAEIEEKEHAKTISIFLCLPAQAFSVVFHKAIERAPPDESLPQRLLNLIDSITFSVFQYTTRGLFECDKLTYTAQVTFQILLMSKEINTVELDFLLRYPAQTRVTSPVEFLSNHSWGGIKALSSMEEFRNLDRDIEGPAKRWKKFVESECPEKEKFPQEWKNKSALQRLCILRAVRPDRMSYAVRDFVEEKLGSKYVVGRSLDFATTFEESGPATPMFFILSPGVDPLKDVEKQGKTILSLGVHLFPVMYQQLNPKTRLLLAEIRNERQDRVVDFVALHELLKALIIGQQGQQELSVLEPGQSPTLGLGKGKVTKEKPGQEEKERDICKKRASLQDPWEEINKFKEAQCGLAEDMRAMQKARSGMAQDIQEVKDAHSGLAEDIQEIQETLGLVGQLGNVYAGLKEEVEQLKSTKAECADLENMRRLFPKGGRESITSILADLKRQVSFLQDMSRALHGEEEKIRKVEDAPRKTRGSGAGRKAGGSGRMTRQPRPKGQKVKAERKELGKQQEPTQAELKQVADEYVKKLVRETAQQLQAEQLDKPRATAQRGGDEHTGCHYCRPETRGLLGKLLQRCEKLEEQVESLAQKVGGKVDNYAKWRRQSLQQAKQLRCLRASIVQLQKDCEKLSLALTNLQHDLQQKQNDIKALSQALERIKKQKVDKEELLVLGIDEKADKDKISRRRFEACMEQLNKVMEEVTGQVKFLHRFQQDLRRQMDCKLAEGVTRPQLDRRELGAFRQQQEERWKSLRGQLQEKALQPERYDAAGIRKNFHNVSLGQGQEVVAEQALDLAAKEGHWVILQNIHLVANWLSSLEKKLEQHSEGSHQDFRVFISAEPAPSPESHIIPQGILENSIKITSEAPTGMHANLHKALDNFNQDTLEMCTRENEFKSILFALCYFHAAVAERRKFGPQGWNRSYPFNTGDLTISVNVLYNYLEASTKVPYDDLRYLFGEIMYGGHITDDWDRRLCKTYLEEFIKPEMLEGELLLAPGFPLPANMDYNGYHQYIDDALPPESPYLDGLHPNAEIGFLTQTSEKLFRTVLEMQPRDTSVGEGGVGTRDETVKALLEEMLEKLMDEFNIAELMAKVEERTPYAVVAFQECERMNILTSEIKRSLKELDLGLKDKDDRDWDFLRTSKPSSGPQKMPVKRGTERSSETTAEQSSRKELPPRQTPLRTVAPVQRRKTSMFEDAEGDDLLDVLRRGKGPKKEEELRPARSTLDDLFGRGSAAKVLEKPEEEERGDKKELVFGEYKPSMGSRPAVQPAMGQLVRRNPVRRRRAGDDWLGWEDEEDFMDPAGQLGAAEEAAPKPDPMDWLIDALARRRAEEQAKAQETKAETTETQEKKAKPSETEEKKAEPSEAQEKKNEPSEAQDTTAEPSETAGEGPGPRSPGSQLAASPAASDCRAELLSAQARVAELESQVRMVEEEQAQQQVLLESAQRQHQEHLDVQESSHRQDRVVDFVALHELLKALIIGQQGQQELSVLEPGQSPTLGLGKGKVTKEKPGQEEKERDICKKRASLQDPWEEINKFKEAQCGLAEDMRAMQKARSGMAQDIQEVKDAHSGLAEDIQEIQETLGLPGSSRSQATIPGDAQEPAKPWGSTSTSSYESEMREVLSQVGQLGNVYAGLKEEVEQLKSTKAECADLENVRRLFPKGGRESITSILADLKRQVSFLQDMSRALHGEEEKIRKVEDAPRKMRGAGAGRKAGGSGRMTRQPRPKGQKVKAERKELGKQQEPTEAELKQVADEYVKKLVRETAQQLQAEQLDKPRATAQRRGHEQAGCHFCRPATRVLLGKLLHHCEKLEEQVESLAQKVGGKVDNYAKWRRQSLQQAKQLKCLRASIVQLQKDCEKLSLALTNLQHDLQQKQNDIKALSQALERIKKQKVDKEELLVLGIDEKADKDKISRRWFEACMEQLNKVMEEVTGQVKFLHRFQQDLRRQMDCKLAEGVTRPQLDCRELAAFRQQQEERWKSLSGQLQEKALQPERDDAAGIRKQLLPGFHCLSCDRPLNMLAPGPNFHNVSLGQGQEVVAEQALDLAAKEGHWVILQNIHLVANWLSSLEKKLEQHSEGSHQDFRVFISAEPAPSPESHIIPQGILENSIKITSEAPTGMHANLHKALDNFNQDTLEMCTRENEFKSILFALCYFHAAVAERRKFGPQGWNRSYPFNTGDLTISVNVLYNYLEASTKVPYDDLRYLFGEIMYGGHITDDWDRRLCKTYLEEFIKPEMLEGELLLAPGFPLPANMDYNGYHQYIDDALPPESPYLDGLHPNAEIGFLTQTSEKLFRTVLEMQPRDTSVGEGGVGTRDETVKALLEEMLEKLMDEFNIAELMAKVEERTPYAVVAFQECERMNILTSEIKRSLKELDLGLKDKDDRDWDFLRTSKPSSGPQKMPVKRGTERSSETTAEQSSRKELPPRQTPLRTVAPVQRRKTSMFEDAEGDDLLDVLRRGKGPKKEEELRPARSTLDDLFGRGSAAKVLEKPEEEERGDKKELVFGEYKPSMGSRPAVQPAMGQLVRRNPVRRRRAGDDWLGWEDEEDFMDPAGQLGAAEEAAPKPDPMDWLIDALARRRAEEQAKAQETKAETTETQEKKAKPSETEEKKAEPSEAQEKKNEPSEAQDTTAEPSETAGEGPGPRSPGSQLAASPAASDCRAELLSAQARVAELESQRQELKAKKEQLGRDRQRLDEAWQETRLEKEKVIGAVQRVRKQQEMIRSTKELQQLKQDQEQLKQEKASLSSMFSAQMQLLKFQAQQVRQDRVVDFVALHELLKALIIGQQGQQELSVLEPGQSPTLGLGKGKVTKEKPGQEEKERDICKKRASLQDLWEEINKFKEAQCGLAEDMRAMQKARSGMAQDIQEVKDAHSGLAEDIQEIQETLGLPASSRSQATIPGDAQEPAKPWGSTSTSSYESEMREVLSQVGQLGNVYAGLKEEVEQLKSTKAERADLENVRRLFPKGGRESITSILADLKRQVSFLQDMSRALHGEEEKIRKVEDAPRKTRGSGAGRKAGGSGRMTRQPRPKGQKVKAERKELGKQQEPTEAELKQVADEYVKKLVRETAQQLQAEQLDKPRATAQRRGHEQAGCHFCRPATRVLLGKLLHHCEKLEEQVESLAQKVGGKVDNYAKWRRQSLQQAKQLKCLRASIVQLQKDCEKLSLALTNLQHDLQQKQNDIKALSQALERIKKQKVDKEELLVLGIDEKADKDKISRRRFEACMEQLNKVMEEVTGQVKFLHRFQQDLRRQMDCKLAEGVTRPQLDCRELAAFRQQQEERWKSLSGQLQEKALQPERDDAAGIRKQLLPGFHCLSCDRPLNMLAPGPERTGECRYPTVPRSCGGPHTVRPPRFQPQPPSTPRPSQPSARSPNKVIVPILTNKKNHQGWPQVVSQDIVRHVHNLKSTVFTVVGQVDGKTLLPLPAGSEGIEDVDLENEKSMERIDKSLVYAMESAIIDWSHQIQEALKKESSEPLLQGSDPNPKVELGFWKNRYPEQPGQCMVPCGAHFG